MSKYRNWVLPAFACLAMGFQCEEDYPEPEYSHIFQEALSLTPYKKAYAVGDTLWVGTNIQGK
ncbi:hypothetical protein MKJ04_20645 [Pontibacter sp. E15-1]|uniref:hypothetical protein n=1 Tax=Pontibacter sp. E15-1 TaxID=2919918 RepID=UPI001F4FC967|nr:hypothetical protein [Pontibacter sp. E15-1]MCJ8167262.1 hypothetical protein [Pontibacter sp. E15-1]